MMARTTKELQQEIARLRLRLEEAEQTVNAIRSGEVDSLLVEGPEGLRVYALEGASNTYRVLIEAMNEGAATLTEAGVILYCNSRLARMLELPLQRVMGSSIRDAVAPQQRATLDAHLRMAKTNESRGELRLVNARGEEFPAYLSLNTIESEGRAVVCLVAVDLRPQKRTDELVAAERLASSIIEQTADAMVVCDETGQIIRASTSASKLSACNPLLSRFEDAFPVTLSTGEASRALVLRALRGELVHAAPATLLRRDGLERELLVSAAPLEGAAGKLIGCVVSLVDVSEARRAEQAIRESEARFRTLADNIPQLAWMTDGEGRRFWFNQRWFDSTGMSAEEFEGAGWLEAHHPDHRQRVMESLARCQKTGEVWEDTVPLRARDGSWQWFLARAVPVRNEEGKVVRWFGTHTDITRQRETEDALRDAVGLRENFLSVASHELRTPLTALTLQLGGLRKLVQQGDAEVQARLSRKLDTAVRQGERLNALVDALLNVSRLASGRFPIQLETFELADVVREVLERVADMVARAGCEIRLVAEQPAIGTWDRSSLDQVVMNLLTNAIKYAPGQPIDITVEPDGEEVELRVRDRGLGIPEADQSRIFGRFERAVSSKHYGGLGLGLFITREIIEMLGGTICVQSVVGQGATFVVRLPRVSQAKPE